jgi:PHP family Zn ribbon phosphoesterase
VEQRVEELADRPEGFVPENAIGYRRLLPLSEIISEVLEVESPYAEKVWSVYNPLVERFGDEIKVLLEVSREDLASVAGEAVADAVVRVREGRVKVVPGFDGVYGRLVLSAENLVRLVSRGVQQLNLTDFT